MVVALFNEGAHVPVILFVDVVGKADKVVPEQIGPTAEKLGVTIGFTVILKVVVVAH